MPARPCTSPDDLLTTAQVAELLGKSIFTVNRYAVNGQLPVTAQANGRLYRRRDVDAFIASRRTDPGGRWTDQGEYLDRES